MALCCVSGQPFCLELVENEDLKWILPFTNLYLNQLCKIGNIFGNILGNTER